MIGTDEIQISVQNVDKRCEGRDAGGSVTALAAVDLEIFRGEFLILLGPSGCGKSTLLNLMAGFLKPSSGVILHDGAVGTGPDRRRTGVVQEYALFPWMTVQGNVQFGFKDQSVSQRE